MTSILKVSTIQDPTNSNTALTIDSAGNVTGNAGLAGPVTTGQVLLASEQWTTDRTLVDMMVIDSSKYQTYKLYWWISHGDAAASATAWNTTGLTFLTAANTEVTSYDNALSYKSTGAAATPTHNDATYAGAQSCIWMAGNGQTYDSSGEGIIFVPNNSAFRAGIRGNSMLIGTPRVSTSSGVNYLEEYMGVALTQDPTAITGVRLRSWLSTTGRASKHGTVHLYGLTG
jgi:hypothetical protein